METGHLIAHPVISDFLGEVGLNVGLGLGPIL